MSAIPQAITEISERLSTLVQGRWVKNLAFGTTKKGQPMSKPCAPASASVGEFIVTFKRDGSVGLMRLDTLTHWVTQNGEKLGAWEVTEYDLRTLTPIAKTGTGTGTQVSEA